jgi:glycine hydroxymethyltransferase
MMSQSIVELIEQEKHRQEITINLIASENYASQNVLHAAGSVLTNKYAEGYPGARYYGGCQIIDDVEALAIDLGQRLFRTEHMNVQPHSGSNANMAVYLSHLKPGDTVLGMSLASGGHISHGYSSNFSGKIYNFVAYDVNPETELIDYDAIEKLADQHKPKMIVVGTTAYSRTIDYKKMHQIAQRNHALLFVDIAHIAGLIAAQLHPSPTPYADIVSGTTHKTLRGPRGGFVYCKTEHAQVIDKAIMPGTQGGPLMHIIAAKAIAFQQAFNASFVTYQKQVIKNAQVMATALQNLGYRIVSGGTDTHLFMIDLVRSQRIQRVVINKNVTGKHVEGILQKCGIIVNRNLVPFDTTSPMRAGGIRIGTPAITTRGFGEKEMIQIAHWIDEAIMRQNNDVFLKKLKVEVENLCAKFPIYKEQYIINRKNSAVNAL